MDVRKVNTEVRLVGFHPCLWKRIKINPSYKLLSFTHFFYLLTIKISHFSGILLSGDMLRTERLNVITTCYAKLCWMSLWCMHIFWVSLWTAMLSTKCCSTEYRYAKCNYSEWSYTECHYELLYSVWSAVIWSIMLNGIVLNADIMSVIMIHYRKSPMLLYKVLLCWMSLC